ncbi:MAG: hypothetical protein ACLQAT_18820 [Candidatus Binataceae bacterium]
MRNLAYYRAGWAPEHRGLLDEANIDSMNFWRLVNNNFLDMCALEWCKLFGNEREAYHWKKVVADPTRFKSDLLLELKMDDNEFQKEIKTMRRYRNQWVAHWDPSVRSTFIPVLDIAKKAVWFYYETLVKEEVALAGLPKDTDTGYAECENEAKAVYQRLQTPTVRTLLG